MKHHGRYFLVAITFITIFFAGCNNPGESPSSVPEQELLKAANHLDSMFLSAFNSWDVNAFMQCYWNSPELTAYPPARVMQLKGYEAVKEFYTKDFASNKGAKLEFISNINLPFKDLVVGHGTFRWTLQIPSAPPVVLEARHTVVKAMKDGRMVIIVDHTSAPMMASGPGNDED